MSSIQQTLGEVSDASEASKETEEKPEWTPGESATANECQGCGAHVTKAFVRTHGDEQGRVHACVQCVPQNKVHYLAAGLTPRVGGDLR